MPVFTTGLTIVDHTGHPIYPALDCTECTIDLAYAYYSVYAARPGTRFSFNFIWRNWCDAAPAEPLMIYTSLSEGSLFSLPFDVKLPACTQNDKPSRLASYRLKPDQTRPVGQVYEATAQTFPPLTPTFSPILHYCEANELTANAKFYPDSMSVQYFQLTFINKGKTTCYLQGHPDVQLLDKSKHIMTVDRETTPDTTRSNGRLIAVLPGKAGYLYITWGNWCPLDSPGVDSIRVSLPGRNEAMNVNFVKDPNRAAPIYGPRCIMPDKGSAISVGPFDDEPYFKDN